MSIFSMEDVERINRFLATGEGRVRWEELRALVVAGLPPGDELAEGASISLRGGRKIVVRDGWAVAVPE